MFKKYSKFKQTVDPSASKVDYKKYLEKVVQEKNFFDSNINHTLTHQQKILASKNRELSQRAMALTGNKDMDNVHQAFAKVAKLRYEIDRKAHVRVSPDQFNYRSPQKYSPISSFVKDAQMNRVFAMNGKMQIYREHIKQ